MDNMLLICIYISIFLSILCLGAFFYEFFDDFAKILRNGTLAEKIIALCFIGLIILLFLVLVIIKTS